MSAVIDLLAQLVAIDSVNPAHGGPGEAGVGRFLLGFFGRHGIETFTQPVLPGRENVIAVLPGADRSRRIILEAHMDTVSATPRTTHVKNTSCWIELEMARPTLEPPRVSLNATLNRLVDTTSTAPKKSHLR